MSIAGLEAGRKVWTDWDYIQSKSFLDRIRILIAIFIKFYAMGKHMNTLWESQTMQVLTTRFLSKLDSDYFKEIE